MLLLAGWLAGCTVAPYVHEPVPAASLAGHWAAYEATLAGEALQPECQPILRRPPSGEIRGTVLMFHGFDACPQQYEELAALLAERGFVAVAPLLPGHGRLNPALDRDDVTDLSTPRSWRRDYEALALRMNDLMRAAPGERVLLGLSVGSTAALLTSTKDPALYDRIIVFSPFLGAPGPAVVAGTADALGRLPLTGDLSMGALGWRKICVPKRQAGRGGYCDFRLKHVSAINALARAVRADLEDWAVDVPVQVVGVDRDPSVSQRHLAGFLAAMETRGKAASHCMFRGDVPHSMLSRFDHPGEDLYWLPETLAHTLDFVEGGRPFPVDREAVELGPLCLITARPAAGQPVDYSPSGASSRR